MVAKECNNIKDEAPAGVTERDLVVVFFPGLFAFLQLLLASFRDRVVSVITPGLIPALPPWPGVTHVCHFQGREGQ